MQTFYSFFPYVDFIKCFDYEGIPNSYFKFKLQNSKHSVLNLDVCRLVHENVWRYKRRLKKEESVFHSV